MAVLVDEFGPMAGTKNRDRPEGGRRCQAGRSSGELPLGLLRDVTERTVECGHGFTATSRWS